MDKEKFLYGFSERLHKARKESGAYRKYHSQTDIGKAVGVSRPTYSSWETGKSCPDVVQLMQLCEFLDCDPGYLLGTQDVRKVAVHDVPMRQEIRTTPKIAEALYLLFSDLALNKDVLPKLIRCIEQKKSKSKSMYDAGIDDFMNLCSSMKDFLISFRGGEGQTLGKTRADYATVRIEWTNDYDFPYTPPMTYTTVAEAKHDPSNMDNIPDDAAPGA